MEPVGSPARIHQRLGHIIAAGVLATSLPLWPVRLLLACIVSAAILASPSAEGAGVCGSNYCQGRVTEIRVSSSSITVRLDIDAGAIANLTSASLAPDNYFTLSTTGLFKEVYAAILAAQLTDSEILLRLVTSSTIGEIQYVRKL